MGKISYGGGRHPAKTENRAERAAGQQTKKREKSCHPKTKNLLGKLGAARKPGDKPALEAGADEVNVPRAMGSVLRVGGQGWN